MNNKVSFDEILHVYTVSQAARPFFFIIVTFKDFFSSDDKGNMYLMQKKVPKGLAVSVRS